MSDERERDNKRWASAWMAGSAFGFRKGWLAGYAEAQSLWSAQRESGPPTFDTIEIPVEDRDV